MNGGRLTVWIDGREALPVRAIPYVAGWDKLYHPESVARNLARKVGAPFDRLRNLVAYHRPAGKPLQVMAHEWNAVVVQVKGFETGLQELRTDIEATDDHVGIAAWEKGAAMKLPAGVFVWLDEFLREREADRKRTPDNVPVTLAPMLDAHTRAAVLEGFEDCPRRGPDADLAMIGYADFMAICQVDDPKNFDGFRVEANGLYVVMPDANATLTPEERAAVSWHPTGQYDKSALPLPCTLGELRAFLSNAGLLGCLDEETVNAILADGRRAAAYENIGKCLDGYWEKLWSELPEAPRQAWHKVIAFLGDDVVQDGRHWDGQSVAGRKRMVEDYDYQHDPVTRDSKEGRAWADLGYWAAVAHDFGTVDWEYWISLQSWRPREAACLLRELDPNEYDNVASNNYPQPIALIRHIADIERRANREQKADLLRDYPSPREWVVWAAANGYALPGRLQAVWNDALWDYVTSVRAKRGEIAKWEAMNDQGIPSEAKIIADTLIRLRAELEVLKQAPPGASMAEKQADVSEAISVSEVGAGETAVAETIARIKRSALIAKYEREWHTIEDDLRHSNENGLRRAAKLPEHGYWNETAAARWADERGKLLTKQKQEAPKLDPVTAWGMQK